MKSKAGGVTRSSRNTQGADSEQPAKEALQSDQNKVDDLTAEKDDAEGTYPISREGIKRRTIEVESVGFSP